MFCLFICILSVFLYSDLFIYCISFNKITFCSLFHLLYPFFTLILVCFVLIYYFVFVVLPVCPLRLSGLRIRCPLPPHEPRVRSGDLFKFHSQMSLKEKITTKMIKSLFVFNQKQTLRGFS